MPSSARIDVTTTMMTSMNESEHRCRRLWLGFLVTHCKNPVTGGCEIYSHPPVNRFKIAYNRVFRGHP
jgi:hypothetical protein